MEYASNESRHVEYEHEKGNTGHSPYMKSGIWDRENYPILEYGKTEIMKLGTWNKVILTFEVRNLQHPLGSPTSDSWLALQNPRYWAGGRGRRLDKRGYSACRRDSLVHWHQYNPT